ncbi:MAG: glycosyltransferase family 2 protein [Candidatus Micrarchaeia archaeon]
MAQKEEYTDTTVIIPVKDEPGVNDVIEDIQTNMPGSKIIIVYKGTDYVDKKYRSAVTLLEQKSDGKGAACYEAIKLVNTEVTCFIDGDSTYSVADLRNLVEEVRKGADIAIGNRLNKLSRKVMPSYIQFGNKMLTLMLNLFYGMNIKDSQTGLRAVKTDAFKLLKMSEKYFGFEEEMLIRAKRKNYNIVELPISYSVRKGVSKQVKHTGGFKLAAILIKHLFDKQ